MTHAWQRIVIVRHGETAWNLTGQIQGHLDSPLTDKGLAQARAVAARLRQETFQALYCSDLGRARKTAEIIADATGHVVRADPRLRERHAGVLHGLTEAEMQERHPEALRIYRGNDPEARIPGGESLCDCQRRVVTCLETLAAERPTADMVVVAHGGTLNAIVRHVLGIPLTAPRRFRLFNGSLNVFSRAPGQWRLDTWGDVAHLQAIGALDNTVCL